MNFKLHSPFQPTGDQPKAIKELTEGIQQGLRHQTLLGVTGSGKTFTMAGVIQNVQKPTLVIAHNKTLAAQLAQEFREFFPKNTVCYFVSYYDYYQPEAYIPTTDTYIEKDTDINDEIDRLRHAATFNLLTRSDVIIVASVSCIYGIGSPDVYKSVVVKIKKGQKINRDQFLHSLIDQQYERNDFELRRGIFRVKGDVIEIFPAYEDRTLRIELFGDEVDKITLIGSLTGEILKEVSEIDIFPAKHFVTPQPQLENSFISIKKELKERVQFFKSYHKDLEAQRLLQRTNFDLEMMSETGYCSGIENYSRHLDGRAPGQPPSVLLDYFPTDFLLFIDESHMTIPQIRGMHEGDRARKDILVEYGFRLPSARDNRPLKFPEFNARSHQIIYTSATPAEYEIKKSGPQNENVIIESGKKRIIQPHPLKKPQIVEQIVRPTGLVDPQIEVRPTHGQVDDLLNAIKEREQKKQRILVTTLTKRLAEELSQYLAELGIKVHYLHSEIETLERINILRDLRLGKYDVVVGINLLREGLDLPEVSLVAILDADKEGFLRSQTALIQTIGRASRHIDGKVLMYADVITGSMRQAINETNRRREIQIQYNQKHDITPRSIKKAIRDIGQEIEKEKIKQQQENAQRIQKIPEREIPQFLADLEDQMDLAAKNLDFERAAEVRDLIIEIKTKRELKKRFK